MIKVAVRNILFKPTLFFKSVNRGEIPFMFAAIIAAANYIIVFVVYDFLGYSFFVPESFVASNFETVINAICELVMFPLFVVFFLKQVKKHKLMSVFIAIYSIYFIEIIMNLSVFVLGTMNLLNGKIFLAIVMPFSMWKLLLIVLAIYILSGLSKAQSLWVVLKALFIAIVLCAIIKIGPDALEIWRNDMPETTQSALYPYTVKESQGKLLSYNMNYSGQEPEPIRCITKDKAFVNVFLEIKFRLMTDQLRGMYKRFEKVHGYYEPEMELKISNVVKATVFKNYAVEDILHLKTDEFESDISLKVKEQLLSIGIDLVDLKIIKIEKVEIKRDKGSEETNTTKKTDKGSDSRKA